MSKDFTELRGLLDAVCEESIAPEQMARLEEIVLADPEAESFYVQYMGMWAEMHRHFAPATAGRAAEHIRERQAAPVRSARKRRLSIIGLAVCGLASAAALLFMFLGLHGPTPNGESVAQAGEPIDNSVAVLSQVAGAEWEGPGQPTGAGAPLAPGKLRLKRGLARIEFYSGATVILEGRAELELISPDKVRCTHGKLRATVPPQAIGFTVDVPGLHLVDRGTEFGVAVADGTPTEVHVFKGKVELHDRAAQRELTTGQALRWGGDAAGPMNADASRFVSAEQLAQRLQTETQRRQQSWLAESQRLRADPALLLYYPFDDEPSWNGTLHNQSAAFPTVRDGAVIGCQWVEGRWPGKRGLEFKRVGDRVRFHVPGHYDSLTLLAWVRVDGLDRLYNSLMLTDGWEEGAPHWQIGKNGEIILGVQGPQRRQGHNYTTPVIFRPERLGQWVQLAVVFDRAARQVTHYVDGLAVSREPVKVDVPLQVGSAEVGNWSLGGNRNSQPIRNFNGRIDEFLMFARPLGDREIQQLYEQGKPRS